MYMTDRIYKGCSRKFYLVKTLTAHTFIYFSHMYISL